MECYRLMISGIYVLPVEAAPQLHAPTGIITQKISLFGALSGKKMFAPSLGGKTFARILRVLLPDTVATGERHGEKKRQVCTRDEDPFRFGGDTAFILYDSMQSTVL